MDFKLDKTEQQPKTREIVLDEPMNVIIDLQGSGSIKDSGGEILGNSITCFVIATNSFHGIAPWDKGNKENKTEPVAQWYDNLLFVPSQGKHNDLFDQVSDRTICGITRDKYHMTPFFDATKKIRANEELEDLAYDLNEELGFTSKNPLRIQPWMLCPWVLSFRQKSNDKGNYAAMAWSLIDNPTPRQQETQLKVVRFFKEHFQNGERPDSLNIEIGEMNNLTYLEPTQKRAYKQLVSRQSAAASLNEMALPMNTVETLIVR